MVVKELQPENAALPIVTSLLGKLTDLMFSQFSNADDAMKRVSGFIVQVDAALSIISIKYESAYLMLSTTGKDVHPSNASSMLVTLVGIFIVVKAEQSLKVLYPMFVKPSGSSIEVNAEHPSNTRTPMCLIDLGREILSNEVQPKKAQSPILFTPSLT